MYVKILRETGSQFTILVVKNDIESHTVIKDNFHRFFKQIIYVSNADEALELYHRDKYDLIIVDIDTFDGAIDTFFSDIRKQDAFQTIVVCSEKKDDPILLMQLLNQHISGFIVKSNTQEEIYKVLSKVCQQAYERQMLLYYLNVLEEQQKAAIDASCSQKCPMKAELKNIQQNKFSQTPQPEEEDDLFEFFPTLPAQTTLTVESDSLYKDYFNLLDADDRADLHDLLIDIDSTLINAFTEMGADSESIVKLGNLLMRYGNVLMHYQFFSDMGTAILEFGKVVSDESEKVAIQDKTLHSLIGGFCSGLQGYMLEVWEKESDNPKFFNDSIINDVGVIKEMIVPPVVVDNDDDLVFF